MRSCDCWPKEWSGRLEKNGAHVKSQRANLFQGILDVRVQRLTKCYPNFLSSLSTDAVHEFFTSNYHCHPHATTHACPIFQKEEPLSK